MLPLNAMPRMPAVIVDRSKCDLANATSVAGKTFVDGHRRLAERKRAKIKRRQLNGVFRQARASRQPRSRKALHTWIIAT